MLQFIAGRWQRINSSRSKMFVLPLIKMEIKLNVYYKQTGKYNSNEELNEEISSTKISIRRPIKSEGINLSTLNQMLQRLPIALTQV